MRADRADHFVAQPNEIAVIPQRGKRAKKRKATARKKKG